MKSYEFYERTYLFQNNNNGQLKADTLLRYLKQFTNINGLTISMFRSIYITDKYNQKIKQNITDNDSNIYNCDFCQNVHQIPGSGFILNKSYIEMMSLNLHLNEMEKTAKNQIDKLEYSNKEIDLMSRDPHNFIYSYFAKEKNKIDQCSHIAQRTNRYCKVYRKTCVVLRQLLLSQI